MAIEIRCKVCGTKCLDTDNYCPNCHSSIATQGKSYEAPIENIDAELWKRFIGLKSESFLKIYRKNEGKKFFVDFNPFAFLFKSFWFLYRKMYVQAIIIELFAIVYSGILTAFVLMSQGPQMLLAIPLAFIFPIVLALLAPLIYRNHVIKCIKKDDMSRSGSSLTPVFVVLLISLIIRLFVIEPIAVFFMSLLV